VLFATFFGIFVIPVLFVAVERVVRWRRRPRSVAAEGRAP
jgi:hypothetical protein